MFRRKMGKTCVAQSALRVSLQLICGSTYRFYSLFICLTEFFGIIFFYGPTPALNQAPNNNNNVPNIHAYDRILLFEKLDVSAILFLTVSFGMSHFYFVILTNKHTREHQHKISFYIFSSLCPIHTFSR